MYILFSINYVANNLLILVNEVYEFGHHDNISSRLLIMNDSLYLTLLVPVLLESLLYAFQFPSFLLQKDT